MKLLRVPTKEETYARVFANLGLKLGIVDSNTQPTFHHGIYIPDTQEIIAFCRLGDKKNIDHMEYNFPTTYDIILNHWEFGSENFDTTIRTLIKHDTVNPMDVGKPIFINQETRWNIEDKVRGCKENYFSITPSGEAGYISLETFDHLPSSPEDHVMRVLSSDQFTLKRKP